MLIEERGESEGRGEGVKEERRGGGGRKEGRERKGERERGGKKSNKVQELPKQGPCFTGQEEVTFILPA